MVEIANNDNIDWDRITDYTHRFIEAAPEGAVSADLYIAMSQYLIAVMASMGCSREVMFDMIDRIKTMVP